MGAGKKGQVHILKNNRHYWQGTRRAGTSSCPPWSPQASCDCRKEKLGVHVDRLLHLTNFGTPLQNACTPGVTTSLKRYSVPQAASLRRPAAGPRHRVATTAPIAQPSPQTAPPLILRNHAWICRFLRCSLVPTNLSSVLFLLLFPSFLCRLCIPCALPDVFTVPQ